jgi:hypothetical protein
VRLGLLGREPPGANELGDEGVVLGQLVDLVVADEVGAGVSDVADRDDPVLEQGDGNRRPHPRGVRVLTRTLVDLPVRLLDERNDTVLAAPVDGLAERRGRDARRDLAAASTAHAVGDGEDRRVADPGVLVAAALPPRMGEPRAAS